MRHWRGDGELEVGYGEAALEAPVGGSMPGYFADRKAAGILDPLMARAVYLRRGEVMGALVALDLIGLGAPEVAACRGMVQCATGIPPANIWVHATHTHTGMMVPRHFTSDAEAIAPEIYVGTDDEDWVAALPGRVAEAIVAAKGGARPGPFEIGRATAERLAFYRRFRMKDGTVRTNPGRGNPDVVAPAGSADPTLTALRFPAAKTVIAVFGLHPDVIGGNRFSADYPAHLVGRVREGVGKDWGVLFLNAACGNINHIDVSNADQGHGYEESTRIGRALGEATLGALEGAERAMTDELGFASRIVPSRLRTVPEETVREAERLLKEDAEKARSFNGLFAPAALVLGRTKDRQQEAEITALRIGPVGLAGMPGEVFVELARQVQHDSPFDPTRVIGLTNGSLGYIPHAAAYEEGGYEAGYRSARFEPRTGHRWAEAAVGLLRDLARA